MEDKSRNMAESRLKGLIMLGGLDLYPIWNKKPTGDDQKNSLITMEACSYSARCRRPWQPVVKSMLPHGHQVECYWNQK